MTRVFLIAPKLRCHWQHWC